MSRKTKTTVALPTVLLLLAGAHTLVVGGGSGGNGKGRNCSIWELELQAGVYSTNNYQVSCGRVSTGVWQAYPYTRPCSLTGQWIKAGATGDTVCVEIAITITAAGVMECSDMLVLIVETPQGILISDTVNPCAPDFVRYTHDEVAVICLPDTLAFRVRVVSYLNDIFQNEYYYVHGICVGYPGGSAGNPGGPPRRPGGGGFTPDVPYNCESTTVESVDRCWPARSTDNALPLSPRGENPQANASQSKSNMIILIDTYGRVWWNKLTDGQLERPLPDGVYMVWEGRESGGRPTVVSGGRLIMR